MGKGILNHEDKQLHHAAAYDALLCPGKVHRNRGCDCVVPVS